MQPTALVEDWPWMERLERIVGFVFVVAGAGLAVVHYVGGADGLPNAEFGALAFGAPYSVLGWLAYLGGRSGRPALTLLRARRWCSCAWSRSS